MKNVKIAIGSANPVKQRAARSVLDKLYPGAEFVALEVPSGVRAQPWGDAETRQGALNRARAVLEKADATLGVGFEGGVVPIDEGLILSNWAAVISAEGRIGLGCGGGVMLPPEVAAMLHAGMELGPAMDQLTGGHDTKRGEGAVGILTAGLLNRQAAFEYTLMLALAPFRSAQWYPAASLKEGMDK